jgi:hypothetical protein
VFAAQVNNTGRKAIYRDNSTGIEHFLNFNSDFTVSILRDRHTSSHPPNIHQLFEGLS